MKGHPETPDFKRRSFLGLKERQPSLDLPLEAPVSKGELIVVNPEQQTFLQSLSEDNQKRFQEALDRGVPFQDIINEVHRKLLEAQLSRRDIFRMIRDEVVRSALMKFLPDLRWETVVQMPQHANVVASIVSIQEVHPVDVYGVARSGRVLRVTFTDGSVLHIGYTHGMGFENGPPSELIFDRANISKQVHQLLGSPKIIPTDPNSSEIVRMTPQLVDLSERAGMPDEAIKKALYVFNRRKNERGFTVYDVTGKPIIDL